MYNKLIQQSKSPGSSIIPLHSDTPSMESVKVYKDPGTYNVKCHCVNHQYISIILLNNIIGQH